MPRTFSHAHASSFAPAQAALQLAGLLALSFPATAVATPGVQIGRCAGLDALEASRDAGFDYVELPVKDLAAIPDDQLDAAIARHRAIGLPTPVGNLFVPSEIRLTGPDLDLPRQRAYVRHALARARRFGVKLVVFGSGGARRVPDGFSHEAAFKQLVQFGRMAAREARRLGITIAVEPLRRQECNIINTAAEGLKLVRAVAHPHFQLMVDLYHLASEGESPEIIVQARKHVRHFHVANPEGRRFPLPGDAFDYRPFFAALRAIRFSGGVSVEAGTEDFAAEAGRTIAFLQELAHAGPAAR